jgi:hypothetical protein
MGQAAVDLPDTPGPPTASAASTDDLLAQMAGEEIDRLLAEADERPAAAAPAPPAEPLQQQPFLSAAAPPAGKAPESDASQLRGFLGGLADDAGPDPVAELAGSSHIDAAGTPAGQDRADPLDEVESIAERAALTSPAHSGNVGASVSLIVRVLTWINSPLDSCPEHVREAIGKVAILTAVNAVAVLAYLLFFRHH